MRTSTTNANEIKKHRLCYKILAAAVWILVWQLASMWLKQEILLASPVSVIRRLGQLIVTADFWRSIGFSFGRIVLGFTLALPRKWQNPESFPDWKSQGYPSSPGEPAWQHL